MGGYLNPTDVLYRFSASTASTPTSGRQDGEWRAMPLTLPLDLNLAHGLTDHQDLTRGLASTEFPHSLIGKARHVWTCGGHWSLPSLNRCALYPEHVHREQLPGPENFPDPEKSKIVLPRPYELAIVLAYFSLFVYGFSLVLHCFIYAFSSGCHGVGYGLSVIFHCFVHCSARFHCVVLASIVFAIVLGCFSIALYMVLA